MKMKREKITINDPEVLEAAVQAAREQLLKPQWEKPTLEEEKAEIERTADELKIDVKTLLQAFEKAELEELADKDWLALQNTQSSDPNTTIKDARYICKGYGRNFKRIEKGLRNGHTFPAPLVLYRKNQPPYLIGGNSRLLGCRGLGLRPTVLALRLKSTG